MLRKCGCTAAGIPDISGNRGHYGGDRMIAPIKYPGAKWSYLDWILSYIPDHKVYLEPFLRLMRGIAQQGAREI